MTGTLRTMWTCHWSARRLQRYLDADPDAPLTPGEVARLEEHLATCERCARAAAQHRALHRALSLWSAGSSVDPRAIERMRGVIDDLSAEERP